MRGSAGLLLLYYTALLLLYYCFTTALLLIFEGLQGESGSAFGAGGGWEGIDYQDWLFGKSRRVTPAWLMLYYCFTTALLMLTTD